MESDNEQKYLNPHVSGVLIGIIITVFYAIFGCEITIANVFTKITTYIYSNFLVESCKNSKILAKVGENPLYNVMLALAFGIMIGAFISALINKRIDIKLERGKTCRKLTRIVFSCIGGFLTSFGIIYISGGIMDICLYNFTMQSIGGFLFLISFFICGYISSFMFWRQWND